MNDESTFLASDGTKIFFRRWLPDGDVRAVVVIAHGASEHSGRYDRFARFLGDAGFASFALDHRGHGRTSAATGVGRIGGSGDALVTDLDQLVQLARTEHPGIPAFLFGHSMGSMIAQAAVGRIAGLSGYVLSGCPGPSEVVAQMVEAMDGAVAGGMGDEPLDALGQFNEPFEPARTKFDWLSRDEAEVDAYCADEYCGDRHPLTYGFFAELLRLTGPPMQRDAIAAMTPMPVLLITGERDPAAGMGENVRVLEKSFREAGFDVTAHYYPEARHEVLNEINRDEVQADVLEWLEGQLASATR